MKLLFSLRPSLTSDDANLVSTDPANPFRTLVRVRIKETRKKRVILCVVAVLKLQLQSGLHLPSLTCTLRWLQSGLQPINGERRISRGNWRASVCYGCC